MIWPIEAIPIPSEERITALAPCHIGGEDVLFIFTASHIYKVRKLRWYERLLRWAKFKVEKAD